MRKAKIECNDDADAAPGGATSPIPLSSSPTPSYPCSDGKGGPGSKLGSSRRKGRSLLTIMMGGMIAMLLVGMNVVVFIRPDVTR